MNLFILPSRGSSPQHVYVMYGRRQRVPGELPVVGAAGGAQLAVAAAARARGLPAARGAQVSGTAPCALRVYSVAN